MKMFLKILLAANFLLQISLAHHEDGHENHSQDNEYDEYHEDDHENHSQDNKYDENHEDDHENDYHDNEYDEYGDSEDEEDHGYDTSGSHHDNGYSGDEEDHGYDRPKTHPDNAIYEEDIVPCESISTHHKKVQEEITSCHNEYRSKVKPKAGNMLRLEWSDELSKSAQNWANTCNYSHSKVQDRNVNGHPYGENIVISPACIGWRLVIKQWWNEHYYMIYGVGPIDNQAIGHYGQMVTAHTGKVGCGMKDCSANGQPGMFYVCQYYPIGNRPSSHFKPYKRGEPCSYCQNACDESGTLCLNACGQSDTYGNCKDVVETGRCDEFRGQCDASCFCKNKIT